MIYFLRRNYSLNLTCTVRMDVWTFERTEHKHLIHKNEERNLSTACIVASTVHLVLQFELNYILKEKFNMIL